MTGSTYNLLSQPLVHAAPCGALTLPGLLAALARDEVESFPALRPHQGPGWHMVLVQLAALALHGAGTDDIPEEEAAWAGVLRGLTPGFADDEPWCLVVDDWTKPAFLQPPVPEDVKLGNAVPSADALDLLITSRNHDLKQAVARNGQPEDWAFALVSLQTGEGYGGAGNQGIARMNGGSSSRPLLALAPLPAQAGKAMTPRPGAWFRRDLAVLLETRASELRAHAHLGYPETGGIGLTWLAPWPEREQLRVDRLDIWFIEVCRRIRLAHSGDGPCGDRLSGWKGTSKATRIDAKHLNGALGDPFAPIHKAEGKSFTLAGRDFDYRTLTQLILSGDWIVPLLARPASFEREDDRLVLVAQALARGNSKTEGFKSRILPLGGTVSRALGARREELHALAQAQMTTIATFDKVLGHALALAAANGERDAVKKEHFAHARDGRSRFDRAADALFFPHLWDRFEAQERGDAALQAEQERFAKALFDKVQPIFEAALPAIPCASFYRYRAEARARRVFIGTIRGQFPELFPKPDREESEHAA